MPVPKVIFIQTSARSDHDTGEGLDPLTVALLVHNHELEEQDQHTHGMSMKQSMVASDRTTLKDVSVRDDIKMRDQSQGTTA